jgi:lipopolysaccharide/colanic/teichoic acid biosynthesis glycosyltransferase
MEYKPIVALPSATRPFDPRRKAGMAGVLLSTNRFVLGVALVLGIIVPQLLQPYFSQWGDLFAMRRHGVDPTVFIVAAAIVAAHLSLQRMGTLPLISARSLILPSFIAAFSAAVLAIYAFKIPAEKYHVWTGFLIGLCWYYAVSVLRTRLARPVIGLFSDAMQGLGVLPGNIEWRVIERPVLRENVAAMVVDPHAAFDLDSSQLLTRLVLEGVPVYHRSHFEEGLTGRVRFHTHADNNFGALLPSLTYLRLKRFIDVAGVIVLLPLIIPIILTAAILIKLDSPGPVLFRQSRMGFRGQPFDCYKLRTMRPDQKGPAFTLAADPRVTRIGKFLRKWRIDELPQTINILRGEMSWIGPRPEAVQLAEKYAAHVPFYDYRHAVRPGISGWAAVHQGNVAEVDAAREKLEYDFYYIKYFSFWLDFLIVLKTLQTIWSGFGSR